MSAPAPPIKVFISYAHRDEDLRKELDDHLSNLKRQKIIDDWHDRQIVAGQEWAGQIDEALNSAQVVLLLVSARFMASDYCHDKEMLRAMARHEAGEAVVIPVILSPCDWQGALFSKLQALPRDARPVKSWADRDEAWLNVAQGIRIAVERLQKKANQSGPPPGATPAGQGNVTVGGNVSGSIIITGDGATVINNPTSADKQLKEAPAVVPELSFKRKQQFVEALLACDCLKTPQSLNQVIAGLPHEIGARINRHSSPRQDVVSIVNTCLQFPAGVARLLEIVSAYEGDSLPWRRVQAVAREIFLELPAE